MKSLEEIFQAHQGKVSDKWELYLREYDRLFSSFRDRPVHLLELGVQNGGSLEIWSQYFPKGEIFVGCDIDDNCSKLLFTDQRIKTVIGDINTGTSYGNILSISKHYDIIIDDGSHSSGDVVRFFAKFFPQLKNDGLFVVEDIHCSYWQDFEGGLYYPYSSMAFFKKLADVLNHEHWRIPSVRRRILKGFCEEYSCWFSEDSLSGIHSIEFINSMCVVRKFTSFSNQLGPRRISGREESVVKGLHSLVETLTIDDNEKDNPWSNLDKAPEESFAGLSADLLSSTEELVATRNELAARDDQISLLKQIVIDREESMAVLNLGLVEREEQVVALKQALEERDGKILEILNSRSWRLTASLRTLGTYLRRVRQWPLVQKSIAPCGGAENTLVAQPPEGESAVAAEDDYAGWISCYDTLDETGCAKIAAAMAQFSYHPKISVILPVYDPPLAFLEQAISSVRNQLY
jgi:hypothetical protein